MKFSASIAIGALASTAAARFSGQFTAAMYKTGGCWHASVHATDDQIPGFRCNNHEDYCKDKGNEIVRSQISCTSDHDGGSTIKTKPHDLLQFCRKGFCSCMNTRYSHDGSDGNSIKYVYFDFDDANAWSCAAW